MKSLGENLRALRKGQGLTLQQLGKKVSLSASYLSQVERGVTLPSLSRLTSIAQALGVELRDFFETNTTSPYIVRALQRTKLKGNAGISIDLLSVPLAGKIIQPYYVVLGPGAYGEDSSGHQGEECGFVLQGELTVTIDEENFVLAAGDSIHYQGYQPHSWHNHGDQECVVLWTVSPARPTLGGPEGKEPA